MAAPGILDDIQARRRAEPISNKILGMRFLPLVLLPAMLAAQSVTTFEGFPAFELANDRITLVVTKRGGSMNSLTLNDDAGKLNPMWEPIRMAQELGDKRGGGTGGHFVCVDGFGPVSPEEREAGLGGHGEARMQDMEVLAAEKNAGTATLSLRATLPIVQEVFTRTYRMVDGEQVIYVDSELENLLGFDRPIVWAEHATVGSPFLSPEVTVTDLPAARSQVRPHKRARKHILQPGADFAWPMAPGAEGGLIDVRAVPPDPDSLDHTTSLMDRNREHQFVTALNLKERMLIGYLFRRSDFPWLQTWDNYPATLKMSRGIEFSTQPYDVPRREAISTGTMFGAPTYRWLPAKSKIHSRFLVFYTRVPAGFRKVDDVRLEGRELVIEDRVAGLSVRLAAVRGLRVD